MSLSKDPSQVYFEKINLQKMEEYFKNINSEFGEMLKKEILINNRLLAEQNSISTLRASRNGCREMIIQAQRNFYQKFGGEVKKLTQ